MTTDTIKHGETYDISVTATDADEVAIAIDDTWQAAIRITRAAIGGQVVVSEALAIADSAATLAIDTGASPWTPGTYYYDVRFTDPDGHDFWTDPVKLILEARNTPSS